MARGSNKQRFQYCLDSSGNLLYLRDIQGHSARLKVDPTVQHNVMLPNNSVKYIYHLGCSHNLHYIIQSVLIAGGKDARKGRQTVFLTAVDPVNEHLTKEQHYHRVVPYKSKWKVHENEVYWVNVPVAQKKALTFYQTQSNAMILHNSVPADCIERVVNMKSQEMLFESARLSPRPPPKKVLQRAWQVRYEDHQHADERNSDGEHGETRSRNDIRQDRREEHQKADEEKFIVECGATCTEGETETHLWEIRHEGHQETDENRSNVEYGETSGGHEDTHSKVDQRIQGIHNAAVKQEDDARRQLISRMVCQIKNHPNKNALIADLQQDQLYNPISEKTKEMIHDMGNVEYFETCGMSSKVQCNRCLKYWTIGIVYCTCGTCIIPTERTRRLIRERFHALSVPNFVIKKGPHHGARHCRSEAQREYCQAHQCLKKEEKRRTTTQFFNAFNKATRTENRI